MGNEHDGRYLFKTMGGDVEDLGSGCIRVEAVDPGEAIQRRGASSHLSLGFRELEERMGGVEGGDLVVVASDATRLLSSFVISLIQRVCVVGRHPVVYFNPGSDASNVFFELLVNCGRLNGGWKWGYKHDEVERFDEAKSKLANADLFVHDAPYLTLSGLIDTANEAIDAYGARIVFVNHVDLVHEEGITLFRSTQIEETTRGLKQFARERNVILVLLVQAGLLSGTVRRFLSLGRYDYIDRYADSIMFLHGTGKERPGEAEISLIRSRRGAFETIRLAYIEDQYRFEDLATPPGLM